MTTTIGDSRKLARKASHTIIERRRRDKINYRLSQLKEMIPSCSDRTLHKLDILDETVAYIEHIQAKLKLLESQRNAWSADSKTRDDKMQRKWITPPLESDCSVSCDESPELRFLSPVSYLQQQNMNVMSIDSLLE